MSSSRQPTTNERRQHHHRDHNDDENATAEMAFQLIERGNAFEKTGNCWAAAENYGRSVHILHRLSKASLEEATTTSPLSTTTTSTTTISNKDSLAKRVAANKKIQEQINKKIQEQIKISKLYSMKSNEYLIEGRKCFFKAITFENELDEMRIGLDEVESTAATKTTTTPTNNNDNEEGQEQISVSNMISEDEAQRRLRIFSCLYAHNVLGEEVKEEKEGMEQSKKEQTVTTEKSEISQTKDDTGDNMNDKNNNKQEEKGTSKEEENKNNNKDNNDDDDNVDTKQINNIEERLQELNDTLPSGFKTSKERMNDIDRGLRRLGLSLYSHQDEKNKRDTINSITPQISDEEQIEQIMAQAKDEAMYEQKKQSRQQQEQNQDNSSTNNEGINYNDYELDSDSDDDDNDDDYDDDEESDLDLYTTKIQNRKFVRKMIQKAQIKLAKLAALINDKKSIEENDNNNNNNVILDNDEDEESIDDDNSNNNENSELGRKTLLQTRYCLDKALKEW